MSAREKGFLTIRHLGELLTVLLIWIGATGFVAILVASQSRVGFSWPAVNLNFQLFFPLVGLFVLIGKCTLYLLPAHDHDIAPNDAVVSGLVTASAIIFLSSGWLGPILDSSVPTYRPITPLHWSNGLQSISALLLAIVAPRYLNGRASRLEIRTSGRMDKQLVAILLMATTYSIFEWALNLRDFTKWPILRKLDHGTFDITTYRILTPAVAFVLGWAFWHFSRDRSMHPIGIITESRRNEYPALTWSQIVGSNETVAGKDGRRRFRIYGGVIVAAALAGAANGSAEDMVFYAMAAAWLGALGLRGAGKFGMQGQTLVHVPHTKTEDERREELTPVTRREDCEAFVEEVDGTLWFCVARGTASEGLLPVVERVPFDSFGNFEEGSHKQWFRPRGTVSETLDWGVIVAQSSVSRIVLVAQSVDEQAWLIELLVKLQTTFIGPRDEMLRALKEAEHKRRAHEEPTGRQGASIDEAPIKPF